MAKTVVLPQLGSVLKSVTHVATEGHTEVWNLGFNLRPCWCPRMYWCCPGPCCCWGPCPGLWPYSHSQGLHWYLWLLLQPKATWLPGIWSATWDCVGAQGPYCSQGHTDVSGTYYHLVPRWCLGQGCSWKPSLGPWLSCNPGSVLMSRALVATNGHADSRGPDRNLWYCWNLGAML